MDTINQIAKKLGTTVKALNANKIRFDLGKYKPESKTMDNPRPDTVIWYETRKDGYGQYLALYTIR